MLSFKRSARLLSAIVAVAVVIGCSSGGTSDGDAHSSSSGGYGDSPGSGAAAVEADTDSGTQPTSSQEEDAEDPEDTVPRSLSAEQTGGKAFWVLPGPRKLSPTVFGTEDNPKRLVKNKIENAKPPVDKLLKKLPLLVGLPQSGPWGRHSAGGGQILKHGSPFGNKMKPVKGQHAVKAKFEDNQTEDGGKSILDTDDSISFKATFTDPQGNTYKVMSKKAFQPPIPGWQTEGGVLMNSYIGGTTGTFIPLLPKAYSHATFWGIGKIQVNDKDPVARVVVFYITEDIRDGNELALDEEMPLDSNGVQAHLLVPPIKPVPGKGPVPKPVPTAFDLPPKAPKDKQPFIGIYYPDIEITDGHTYVR